MKTQTIPFEHLAKVGRENSLFTGGDFGHAQGKNVGKKKEEAQKSRPKGEQEFMSPAQCSTQSYKHYA